MNQNQINNIDLYEILNVSKESNDYDIRNAYKKLAFENHPDRRNNNDGENFKEINNAYKILSDSKKKYIYDTYGFIGIQFYENLGDNYITNLLFEPNFIYYVYYISSIFIFFFLIQFIFITLKIQNILNLNWHTIYIPSYINNAFIYLLINYIIYNIGKYSNIYYDINYIISSILINIVAIGIIVEQVLLLSKIEYNFMYLYNILIPIYLIEFINIVLTSISIYIEDKSKFNIFNKILYIGKKYNNILFRLWFYILLCLKIDNIIDVNWVIVFIPIYISLLSYNTLLYINDMYYLESIIADTDYNEKRQLIITKNLIITFFSIIFFFMILFINIDLSKGYVAISFFIILSPIYILLSISFCCCSCCLPTVTKLFKNDPNMIPITTETKLIEI